MFASRGGLASAAKRKRRKLLRELIQTILDATPDKVMKNSIAQLFPEIPKDEITNRLALVTTMFQKAINGDTKAFEVLRDTAGEKPGEKLDVSNTDGSLQPQKLEVVFKKTKEVDHE